LSNPHPGGLLEIRHVVPSNEARAKCAGTPQTQAGPVLPPGAKLNKIVGA
jgi:hypothetical protein